MDRARRGIKYPARVKIVEVSPRDGLQNEPVSLTVETRVHLIRALVEAGVAHVECGSFVSPKRVPQMADSAAVFKLLDRKRGVRYSALTPNLKGFDDALRAQVSEVAVFVAASESFSQANVNCSIAESLSRSQEVVCAARVAKIPVRGYVSCVLGCPYEGAVPTSEVVRVAKALRDFGCYEISLGDTIGVGTPLKAQEMLEAVCRQIAVEELAVHFHDTWGQGLANIFASLAVGVSVIDSSVAGLGGCPFARSATGNVATEDVIYLLDGLGIETGVDLQRVAAAGREISAALGRPSNSRAGRAAEAALRR